MIDSPMDEQSQHDVQHIITEALMLRSCNPIQIHLRLKHGINSDATLNRSELNELSALFYPHNEHINRKKDNDAKARELARFYVRIANIRAHIMEEQRQQQLLQSPEMQQMQQMQQYKDHGMIGGKLQRAYELQKETMHQKQRENQTQFERIMKTIVLEPDSSNRCIHPELKEVDLSALELQVQDILERGCATHELRCLKIIEASIEQQKYDALVTELNAMDE